MRDIHVIYVIYADAGFKNRLLLKWSQCKHSKKGTVRRDWNDVDNRNGRNARGERQKAQSSKPEEPGKKTGSMVLRDVLLRLSAYVHV